MSVTKKLFFVDLILFIISILVLCLSIDYELYICNFTFFDLISAISNVIIVLTTCCLCIYLGNKNSLLKYIWISIFLIIGILSLIISSGINELLNDDVKFYEIQVIEGDCEKDIFIKEQKVFYKTAGCAYIKITPFLLGKIDGSSYGYDAGIFPIGSGQYMVDYDKETDVLTIKGTNNEKSSDDTENYHFNISFVVP